MLAIVVNTVITSDCQDNYSSICLCLAVLNTFGLENPIYGACIAIHKAPWGWINSVLVIHTSRSGVFFIRVRHSVNALYLYLYFNAENTLVCTISFWLWFNKALKYELKFKAWGILMIIMRLLVCLRLSMLLSVSLY